MPKSFFRKPFPRSNHFHTAIIPIRFQDHASLLFGRFTAAGHCKSGNQGQGTGRQLHRGLVTRGQITAGVANLNGLDGGCSRLVPNDAQVFLAFVEPALRQHQSIRGNRVGFAGVAHPRDTQQVDQPYPQGLCNASAREPFRLHRWEVATKDATLESLVKA